MTTVATANQMLETGGNAEGELIERAKTDPRAFGTLYRRHYKPVVGYLYRRVGDEHTAEDLAGEAFLSAWKALPRYRVTGVPFRAWVMRIATNAANRWAKKQKREAARHTLAAEMKNQSNEPHDEADEARTAMLALSTRHQEVLSLHYVEGLSVDEVSAVLGCRPGTVKSRLSRGREALRQELLQRRAIDA